MNVEIHLKNLRNKRTDIKTVKRLIIPLDVGYHDNELCAVLIAICNAYRVKCIEVDPKVKRVDPSSFNDWAREIREGRYASTLMTVDTLIIRDNWSIMIPVALLSKSNIKTIIVNMDPHLVAMRTSLEDSMLYIARRLCQHGLENDFSLRKLLFSFGKKSYTVVTHEKIPILDLIERNTRLSQRRRSAVTALLGICMFRKTPRFVNKDMIRKIAGLIRDTPPKKVFELSSPATTTSSK